jgi:hypothetical protein
MADLSLNQLYSFATGLRNVNIEAKVEEIKEMDAATQKDAIGKLLWNIPGGAHKSLYADEFKKKFLEALEGTIVDNADIDGDGDIDQYDVNAAAETPVDIDEDGDIDDNDLAFIKAMSTAEVATSEEDGEDDEENVKE